MKILTKLENDNAIKFIKIDYRFINKDIINILYNKYKTDCFDFYIDINTSYIYFELDNKYYLIVILNEVNYI